jgi:hypothetical protein
MSPADDRASGGRSHPPCMNAELARMLMSQLEDRGLDSRLVSYRGDAGDDERVEEIVIVNPAARQRGEVRLGDDASLTWEYFGSLDEAGISKILDAVTTVLQAPGVRLVRDRRS